MKCDLGFCDEIPEYIILDEGLDDWTNDPLHYDALVFYKMQGTKDTFGVIMISQIKSCRLSSPLTINQSYLQVNTYLRYICIYYVIKHVFEIRMRLLRTYWYGFQI